MRHHIWERQAFMFEEFGGHTFIKISAAVLTRAVAPVLSTKELKCRP
jgi:hypothetical protein